MFVFLGMETTDTFLLHAIESKSDIQKKKKKCANLSKLKGAASKMDALNLPLQMNMLIPYHLIIFGLNNPIWFVRFGSIRSMAGAFVFGRTHCFDSRTIDLWFDFIVSAKFSIFLFCVFVFVCVSFLLFVYLLDACFAFIHASESSTTSIRAYTFCWRKTEINSIHWNRKSIAQFK